MTSGSEARVQRRAEEVDLADEAGRGRDAAQREHEHGQRQPDPAGGGSRAPAMSAMSTALLRAAAHHREHAEGAQVHDRVDRQVEEHGRGARRAARRHRHQDVAGVRDARVGQHALEVVLEQRGHVAHRHGQHRHAPTAPATQSAGTSPSARRPTRSSAAKAGGLRPRRHEGGHRRGRALVGVGRPHVERHRRDLEERGRPAAAARRPAAAAFARSGEPVRKAADARQVRGAGRAVDQRDAVEQEAAGEGAEQEVLERRLVRLERAAPEADQHVERRATSARGPRKIVMRSFAAAMTIMPSVANSSSA